MVKSPQLGKSQERAPISATASGRPQNAGDDNAYSDRDQERRSHEITQSTNLSSESARQVPDGNETEATSAGRDLSELPVKRSRVPKPLQQPESTVKSAQQDQQNGEQEADAGPHAERNTAGGQQDLRNRQRGRVGLPRGGDESEEPGQDNNESVSSLRNIILESSGQLAQTPRTRQRTRQASAVEEPPQDERVIEETQTTFPQRTRQGRKRRLKEIDNFITRLESNTPRASHQEQQDKQSEPIRNEQPPPKKPRKIRSDKGKKRNTSSQMEQQDGQPATADVVDSQSQADMVATPPQQIEPATAEDIQKKIKASAQARRGKRGRPSTQSKRTTETREHNESTSGQDQITTQDDDHKPRKRGRGRAASPSDEEEEPHIDTTSTVMWDLTRDHRKGQISKIERAFRKVDWDEVKKKREEERLRALETPVEGENEANHPDAVTQRLDRADQRAQEAAGANLDDAAPTMKIVNGQLVFDNATLENNTAQATAAAEAEAAAAEQTGGADVLDDHDVANRFNTQTWNRAHKRDKRDRVPGVQGRWSPDSTDKFYNAIRMFGADFTIIQKFFPHKTRRQIKLKFVREERDDPSRIKDAMVGPTEEKVPMSLSQYAEWVGEEEGAFRDPEELNLELEAEREKQQRELEEEEQEMQEGMRRKAEKARERRRMKERARKERNKKKEDLADGEEVVEEGDAEAGAEAEAADGDVDGGVQVSIEE